MCSTCFPHLSLLTDASLSSTGSSRASSPASTVLSKRCDFLLSISPHFVSFAWRYLGCHSLRSLLGGRVSRQGLELMTRYLQPGCCRGNNRISQVPGEPLSSVCHVPNRRRQDCLHQTNKVQQRGPWSSKGKGSHDWVFRRSIAWLSDSLFTLRRDRYLTRRKTRFQLLVKLYWTGFSPARFR
jgi:hypothetical protein